MVEPIRELLRLTVLVERAQGLTPALGESRVIFLGLAERANQVRDAGSDFLKTNIIGLKQHIFAPFHPIFMNGIFVVIAIQYTHYSDSIEIEINNEKGERKIYFQIQPSVVERDNSIPLTQDGPLLVHRDGEVAWQLFSFPMVSNQGLLLEDAGRFRVRALSNGSWSDIGTFHCFVVDPPPLTEDFKSAIRSNPFAAKSVRMSVVCEDCKNDLRFYAGIEKNAHMEADGWLWYSDLPDEYKCKCGKVFINLRSIRSNFHGILGQSISRSEMRVDALYEKSFIENIGLEFSRLVKSRPGEELIQKFIEKNPILLHRFPSTRLFFKPSILTKYKADFAIITPNKELILIEIEKSGMILLTRNGEVSSQLTHAMGQVHDWLHEINLHRHAFLKSLEIDDHEVASVRGVVIAGLDEGYNRERLQRLKGDDRGNIMILTYTDLIGGLVALASNLGEK